MSSDRAEGGRGHGKRRRSRRAGGRAGRLLGWLAVFVSAVLVIGSLSAYAGFRKLAGNLHHQDVASKLGKRPPDTDEAKNILLIGSDTRSAAGTQEYGDVEGARSDTVIVLHLPPGHKRALAISFPRDSLVDIPPCKQPDGSMTEPEHSRLNVAFSNGGPACTWKTVESLTGIRINHFVMVNFRGFIQVVNALGGVKVCLPVDVHDPRSGLNLSAGPHRVKGEQALAFVRVRHNIGDGSDLQRIGRQQEFLASMVKKATSKGLLLNPRKLYAFLDAATKSLTTDTGFGLADLKNLALSARHISPSDVNFVTVPVEASGDGATVVWAQPESEKLFDSITAGNVSEDDSSSTARASGTHTNGSGGASSSSPTMPPPGIQVKVLNGTSVSGLAADTAEKLKAADFDVVDVGNAETHDHETTTVRYDPELEASANVLAGAVSADTETDESLGRDVVLLLGSDARDLQVHRQSGADSGSGQSTGQSDQGKQAGQNGQGDNHGKDTKGSKIPDDLDAINAAEQPCSTGALER